MSLRLRLFDDVTDSPISVSGSPWNDAEIEAVITPYSKNNDSVDSGFESDANFSIKIPSRLTSRGRSFTDARRSLFSGKRPADDDIVDESPASKKLKEGITQISVQESAGNTVIQAVDRLTAEKDLIADGSRDYCLPTIPGKHSDLKSITADTMCDVMAGRYSDQLGEVTIVDCRYPYEFEGGHIRGAVNLYTKDTVYSLLKKTITSDKQHVLIFHCEFSSERGPKMYRFLRSQDRELNKDSYPRLHFPEVYLLDGGYKAFFNTQKNLCEPISYMPMLHEEHTSDLRHFRVKSKSWTAGEKQMTSRRQRSRLQRQSLEF